jgi:hypothetical protein
MRTYIFSTLLCAAAYAQIGAPVLGYLPDGTGIRTMYGIPGAGAIASLLPTGRTFAQSAVSPRQNFVLAVAADNGDVLLYTPSSGSLTPLLAAANPDMILLSPSGSSAALWYPLTGQLQILSGLPSSPALRSIDASFLNASPLALAVSDDGQWAAGLWSVGAYAFGPSAQVVPLQTDPGVVALSFFHGNHALALAAGNRATSIADVSASTQISVLFDYSSQSLSPRAIGASFDNAHVVVADASGKLVNITASTGAASIVDCGCSPTGLYGLGNGVFRLNGTGFQKNGIRTELKLFDAAAGNVFVVPPALSLSGGRQ